MFISGVLFMLGAIAAGLAVRLVVGTWLAFGSSSSIRMPSAPREIRAPFHQRWRAMGWGQRSYILALGLLFACPIWLATWAAIGGAKLF